MLIQKQFEEIKNSASHKEKAKTERIGSPSLGDVVRQGDIYLVCIEQAPSGMTSKTNQLAPGNTLGSRHIVVGNCRVISGFNRGRVLDQIYAYVKGSSVHINLVGPVVVCLGDTTLEHPEHGHKVLPGDTVWAVVYQRAFGEDVRRIED